MMTLQTIERRRRHAWRQRAKLLVQMWTAAAYGALGIAIGDPVVKGEAFTVVHLLAMAFGGVSVYIALYLAPEGERDGDA